MNKKGFTLVELLAVIVILLGLSLLTSWGISSALENRKDKELDEQIELATGAAKIYFSLKNSETCVKVSKLKSDGYFSNNSKIDRIESGSLKIKDGVITFHNNSKCS